MDIIFTSIMKFILTVGPFFLLLGVLIFVHEFGHFIVAKYFGVRVEVFSIGFGKKLFQRKRGDTNYCISAIPLGGYVKMFGDDPSKEIDESQKKYSFLHQPLVPRMLIVLAGPMINLVFAVFIFAVVAMVGENLPAPIVGDLNVSSAAQKAGFKSGDKILKINDKQVVSWIDISKKIKSSPDKLLNFEVSRAGSLTKLSATPQWGDNDNIISYDERVGVIEGFTLRSEAALVGVSNSASTAFKANLPTVSLIEKINNIDIKFYRDIAPALKNNIGKPLNITFKDYLNKDNPASKTVEINSWGLDINTSDSEALKAFGFDHPGLYLAAIKSSSPADNAGLKPGDKLTALNGNPLESWDQILNNVKGFKSDSGDIKFSILRQGKPLTLAIKPEMTSVMTAKGQEEQRFTIGIVPALGYVSGGSVFIRTLNPATALWKGVTQSYRWTVLTVMSFVRLIQNKVSPKNIGGIIAIGRVASESFAIGISAFLKMMAIISINLFILNLLPIPVLDGGHLVFFSIEALKGAPLSLKKMEMAQTVGMVLLMTLMVFALFNDVTNLYSILSW